MSHDHGHMSPPMAPMKKHYTSMTFFWGSKSEVLFTGWPGDWGGMYALALIVMFILAAGAEMVSNHRVDRYTNGKSVVQVAVQTVRVGLMYVLMLAVMSFNGGIFIAACISHVFRFFIFKSAILSKARDEPACPDGNRNPDLPSTSC